MPAPYDYSSTTGYARTRADWTDFPSTTTPITQVQLDQLDQAIYDKKLEMFSVKDFGAKGDSPTTDDTTAIQNTLDACRTAGGGTVFFPAGTYKTTADLVIGSNTLLLGTGRGKSVIKRLSTTATVAVIKNFDRTFGGTDTDIAIENLTVWRDGEATTANTPFDNAIYFKGVTRPSVRNCRVRGGAKGVLAEGCLFPLLQGIWCDTFVDNGIAVNWTGSPFVSYGKVADCIFDTPTASGFSLGSSSLIVTAGGVQISNVVFKDAATQMIELGDSAAFISIDGVVGKWSGAANVHNSILAQLVDDLTIRNVSTEKGDVVVNVNTPASQLNNRIDLSDIHVKTGTIQVKNVAAGSLRGFSASGATGKGIDIASCTDFLVEGGETHGNTLSGVYVHTNSAGPAPARVIVRGVTSYGNGTAGTGGDTYGFYVDGGDTITLQACRAYKVSTAQTHGLNLNATTNFYEEDNDFSGNVTGERAAFTSSPTLIHNPTIASGSTITIPSQAKLVNISGTTNINTMNAAGKAGQIIVLVFAGALTVVDGSNLKLNSNFVTTADDTLTLVSDTAGFWYELARSVN